ncbi:hypothetical protein HK101_007919 [Irineochytrium annulatum]|nr:hypothetical protein HK101_007919 [Irineochytrium annulatum]
MSTNQRLSLIVKAAVGVICLITLVWSAFDTSLLDSFEEASKNSADESWQVHGAIAAAERRLSEERARQERGPDNGEQSVSDMLCSPMRPNPHKIAVCIAGNSRTLRYPLVYKTMKHNVMDAIGGDVTVFAALKLADAPVDHSHDLWPQPMANSYELIEPALDYLNVSKTVIVRSDEIFKPWCVYNRNVVYAPFTTDHFNLMDRRHADIVFNLITWYYNCNEERTEHDPEDLLKAVRQGTV